jgi:chorismate dehydratase
VAPASALLNVGSVPYLVGRPLDLGLERDPALCYTRAVPSQLVEGLRSGRLDIALVSSIELFRRPGYSVLPGPCVAGQGFVGSVQLFLRRPLAETRRIALDPASRTSAALVAALLALDGEADQRFIEVAPGSDPRADGDAWLRIGDQALQESAELGAESEAACGATGPAWNLSAEWRRRTGLPFVFACWIARPGIDLGPHQERFVSAWARGQAAIPALARGAARDLGLDPARLARYLGQECCYRLEPGVQAASLARFRELVAGLGAAEPGLWPAGLPRP